VALAVPLQRPAVAAVTTATSAGADASDYAYLTHGCSEQPLPEAISQL
jgi:hypothetical protein